MLFSSEVVGFFFRWFTDTSSWIFGWTDTCDNTETGDLLRLRGSCRGLPSSRESVLGGLFMMFSEELFSGERPIGLSAAGDSREWLELCLLDLPSSACARFSLNDSEVFELLESLSSFSVDFSTLLSRETVDFSDA